MISQAPFADRVAAGRALARLLTDRYGGRDDVLVLGLPRGGVPVAYEVATALGAPLDVFVVRKLGVPGHEEFAMGALASGGTSVLDHDLVARLGISDRTLEAVAFRERRELARREEVFRGDRPNPDVRGKTVILVDDGLATGATMTAAIRALRGRQPAEVVVAVPIASAEACKQIAKLADDAVCAVSLDPFSAVGQGYDDFTQTTDDEVRSLLDASLRDVEDEDSPENA